MFGRSTSGVLGLAGVALLQLVPSAEAEERMQLGTPAAPAIEFQTQVGDRVFFSEGSADLGSRARAALQAQAAWLKRNADLIVTVEGHADDAGADVLNLEVSWRRAEAVRRRLIESGVAAERIHTVAHGRARLIAECTAPGCSAQNRRAVTIIGAPDALPAPPNGLGRDQGDTAARRAPRRLF